MLITISVLILIICAILALFVLAQNPKGGGLAAGFTGAQQIGGVQRTADFLEKGTWTMAIALMVLCLAAAGVQKGGGSSLDEFDAPSTTIAPGSDFDPNAVNAADQGQEVTE
ncbi:MAG: preprotein translocase subunit SecG [Flavobacteriales bacterium]|nr:preprotein translocase subunit SecG [Flavobacteriales bacterium]